VIAVVGAAGTIGRHVAGFLEEWSRDVRRLDARLEGDERLDASDPDAVAAALDGCTVCVNCADYRLNLDVMRGCLTAGTHYVDLGGLFHVTRRQLELDDAFAAAGLTAVVGMGSAPGKTNLLARAAAERLGAPPSRMEIWAVTRDPAAAQHPFPAPYSVQTLKDELHMRPMVVREGHLDEVEPLSGAAEREFPEPIGRAQGIYTLHSELATLPAAYPTLEEASFRLCLSPGLLDKLLALGDGEAPEPYVQSPESVAVHLVEVGGRVSGSEPQASSRRPDSASGAALAPQNGVRGSEPQTRSVVGLTVTRGGSARSTSEPPARAAVELEEGRLSAPGVHPPEDAIADPEAFLALLDTEVRWL
jgi:saccharopine dehydrogenase-like NADP-dependent oxidoreductase